MKNPLKLQKVDPKKLNARQKENYNFQKASGVLADFGFTTIRLSDDWNGADFIAQHVDGKTMLRVQLKGRLDVRKKYQGKDLWLCFPAGGEWYLCPHDKILDYLLTVKGIGRQESWHKQGGWSYPRLPGHASNYLARFVLK